MCQGKLFNKNPKGDLHNHLSLGMRFSSFEKWAGKPLKKLPNRYAGITGLNRYIKSFYKPHVKDATRSFQLIEMGIEESIRDNVTLLEASIDIGTIKFFDNIDTFLKKIASTKEKYKSQIEFKPDLGISKILPTKLALKWGVGCIKSKLFGGIDLYGPEIETDLNTIKKLYNLASDYKMIKKSHIGEFSHPDSTVFMIESLKLDEVQHGITSADSQETIDFLVNNDIQLNICPESNVRLGAVKNIQLHPIKKLFDSGVRITINTDDLLFFNKSNSEQYKELYDNKILTENELEKIRLNSLRVSC